MKVRIEARQKAMPVPALSSYTFAKVMQKSETTKYFRKNMPKDFLFSRISCNFASETELINRNGVFLQLTLELSIIDANNDANIKDYEYETV